MLRLALVTVLAALIGAGPAHAQWSPPRTVSGTHTFIGPLQLGTGPFATYAWQDGIGNDARTGASASGPAGEVPAPDGLVGTGRYGGTRAIALSSTLVTPRPPQRFRVAASFGSITGGFGTPHSLAVELVVGVPRLAVAPDGRALAAWIATQGKRRVVRIAYRPRGGSFGRPTTLIGRGQTDVVAAGIGAGNDMVVLAAGNGKVIARVRPRLGYWRPIETLATAQGPTQWALAAGVDDGGHVQAVWRRHRLRGLTAIQAVSAIRSRRFGTVQTLEANGASAPVLLGSPEGWVVAYTRWPAAPGGDGIARIHVRPNGQRFGPAIDASPVTPGMRGVSVAADPVTGQLVAGWVKPTPAGDGGGIGQAALRPFGGAFAAPETVTPDEAVSDIAFTPAPSGGFTAAWVARPEGTGPGIPASLLHTVVRAADRAVDAK